MAKNLNETIGTMEYDGLIYDGKHPVDVKTVQVRAGQGVLERGTVLAISEGTGGDDAMAILGTTAIADETLTADCVLADPVDTGDAIGTAVVGVAYRSGHLTRQKLIVKDAYTMTAKDEAVLRNGGIFLSNAVL